MAQQLNDILKQLHDRIKGVHGAQISAGSTGNDAGVDLKPKAGDEDEFVAKHSVEKWDEPYDNPNHSTNVKYSLDTPQNKRMGNNHEKSKKDYFVPEAKEVEEAKCNMSEAGTMCPVHGMKLCRDMKPIREGAKVDRMAKHIETSEKASGKAGKEAKSIAWATLNKRGMLDNKNKKMSEEAIDEVSTKTMGSYITKASASTTDKSLSDNKIRNRYAGVALADKKMEKKFANKKVTESTYGAVQPLIGSSDIAKHKTDDTQEEIEMVRAELKAIANKTMHMLSNMPADHHIEPWIQSKIAAAKEMIGSVHDYMMYSDEPEEDNEQMDTPITLPNMSMDVNTGQNV